MCEIVVVAHILGFDPRNTGQLGIDRQRGEAVAGAILVEHAQSGGFQRRERIDRIIFAVRRNLGRV